MSLLSCEGVTKRFGGVVAVDNVSFSLRQGEIGAVIGPNGAGKTTLFNVITGIYGPTTGKVFLDGQDITAMKPNRIAARGISRTFQNLQVFGNMTLVENVMVGRHCRTSSSLLADMLHLPVARKEDRESHDKAMEMLEVVGLADRAEEPAANLAFGQQRLLEIARAIALEPRLLMLDEPAAGLNGGETRELENLILRLRDKGVTVLLVEHDMETVMKLADHIVVLDFGRKIAEGTPAQIQENEKVIAAYLGEEVED